MAEVVDGNSPSTRRPEWKVGAGAYVVPGTGPETLPKNMEPFVGRIVERCVDEEYYMVYNTQKARAAKKGCRIHVDKITRLSQPAIRPGGWGGNFPPPHPPSY